MAERTTAPSTATLKRLSVAGYKSINARQDIEIRPLTVLAGANSGGKSSLMQPLLMLKQTLEAPYDPGPLLLNGQNVRFTAVDQLLPRKGKTPVSDTFQVTIGTSDSRVTFCFRPHPQGQGIELQKIMFPTERGEETSIDSSSDPSTVLKMLGDMPQSILGNQHFDFEISRERFFLNIKARGKTERVEFAFFQPFGWVEPLLSRLVHVPGLRGNPQRYYPTTGVGQTFPGTFESYVASIVQSWQNNRDDRLTLLGRHLETLGLTWKVQAHRIDDTQVELRVGRLPHAAHGGASDLVSIADVGFGVSQTLPVLVALLVAEAGQIVYLEQPEIHLHPKAQRALGSVLAEAAKRGVIVIVETHSALLLRSLQTLVASGQIQRDLVVLHWVTRDQKSGFTKVSSADLDETGAFGDWPSDFLISHNVQPPSRIAPDAVG